MYYTKEVALEFEWNSSKERINHKKHGIWFDEAKTCWSDSHSLEFYDEPHSQSEDRFLKLGYSLKGRLLMTSFCERVHGNTIRLISSRRATDKERRFYEERI
ncbi:BrnT family toxin [Bdellovibrio bacteriovorus]|uniref:BrnT family toxin n=1 Tax=Bdellovibrio bacteriovorus TaxID=959 RepID=UPI003AA80E2C